MAINAAITLLDEDKVFDRSANMHQGITRLVDLTLKTREHLHDKAIVNFLTRFEIFEEVLEGAFMISEGKFDKLLLKVLWQFRVELVPVEVLDCRISDVI